MKMTNYFQMLLNSQELTHCVNKILHEYNIEHDVMPREMQIAASYNLVLL